MPIKVTRDDFRWTNGRGHNQKPILYSQKTNTHGLGKKEHDSDHWWARAFDNQLKSLDVSTSANGDVRVQQTEKATPLAMTKASRYYIRFVPGGLLTGTIKRSAEEETEASATATPTSSDGERKAARKEKAEKGRRRKERKAKRKAEGDREGKSAKRKGKDRVKRKEETKEERRERKRLKRLVEKELAALGEKK